MLGDARGQLSYWVGKRRELIVERSTTSTTFSMVISRAPSLPAKNDLIRQIVNQGFLFLSKDKKFDFRNNLFASDDSIERLARVASFSVVNFLTHADIESFGA